MDEWFNERNQRYVVEVEVMLAEFFSVDRKSSAGGAADKAAAESAWATAPATWGVEPMQEGVRADQQAQLKSVLWAVGSIGANELGLPFLEAEDVVSQIVEIAETSAVLSVRGTCFFVLGLISSTNAGAEVLQDYGWQSVCTPLGAPMGLCIPDNVDRLVSLAPWRVEQVADLAYLDFDEPQTVVENKIITSIANLGNSILAANASRSLSRLKAKHARAFQDMAVLARAVELMDHFHFRVAVRRYVWELFDVSLDEQVVHAIQTSRHQLVEAKRARTTQQSQQDRRNSRAEPLDAHHGEADGWDSGSGSNGAGESDEAEDEVGLSSNMSSDDEASDTSQDEAKLADNTSSRPLARAGDAVDASLEFVGAVLGDVALRVVAGVVGALAVGGCVARSVRVAATLTEPLAGRVERLVDRSPDRLARTMPGVENAAAPPKNHQSQLQSGTNGENDKESRMDQDVPFDGVADLAARVACVACVAHFGVGVVEDGGASATRMVAASSFGSLAQHGPERERTLARVANDVIPLLTHSNTNTRRPNVSRQRVA
ncbi:hypothetical protein L1887_51410 [Cichorium endivia]|nr:hypothetical protein L1887_51410 [Cichorium endivia]